MKVTLELDVEALSLERQQQIEAIVRRETDLLVRRLVAAALRADNPTQEVPTSWKP